MRCSAQLVAIAVLGLSAPARAFVDASQFFDSPNSPHTATLGAAGEGVYFTGARRFSGLDCATCHAGGPQALSVHLGAAPDGLFSDGYVPGQTYEIVVELLNESAGLSYATAGCSDPPRPTDRYPYVPCNNNSFALEIDDANGPLPGQGVFCAASPAGGQCPKPVPLLDETLVAPGGDAIFGNRIHDATNPKLYTRNDPTSWRFYFTAPPAGTGALTLYLGAVDGDGGDGTADNDQDVFGDDTVRATVPLREAGAMASLDAIAGCAIDGGRGSVRGGPLGLALVGLLWLWRQRTGMKRRQC